MTRLSDIIRIGDFVATSNIQGYEGVEVGVYLGVQTRRREGLLLINWIGSSRAIEQVFTTDFNRYFYPIKLKGFDARGHLLYKRIHRRFTHTDAEISAVTGKPIERKYKKIV